MKKLETRIILASTSGIANFQGEFLFGIFIRSSLTSILGFHLLLLLSLLIEISFDCRRDSEFA